MSFSWLPNAISISRILLILPILLLFIEEQFGWALGLFLAAGLSCAMSIYLFFSGDREQGVFVGLWVPSILSAGNLLIGRDDHE